ncbi:MAG TPA: hypothetical protein VH684_31360 [Xanthobacteraceae bacterium]
MKANDKRNRYRTQPIDIGTILGTLIFARSEPREHTLEMREPRLPERYPRMRLVDERH